MKNEVESKRNHSNPESERKLKATRVTHATIAHDPDTLKSYRQAFSPHNAGLAVVKIAQGGKRRVQQKNTKAWKKHYLL